MALQSMEVSGVFSDSSEDIVEKSRDTKHQRYESPFINWWPVDVEAALGVKDLEVISLQDCDLVTARDDLKLSKEVGLTVVAIDWDEKHRPILLGSKSRIYVLHADRKADVDFLKKAIETKMIKIFTVNGTQDADCIHRLMGLKLTRNQTDLIAFDQYLQVRAKYISKALNTETSFLTAEFVRKHMKPKVRNYATLAQHYLGVDGRSFICTSDELDATKIYPYNQAAKNAFKKHVALAGRIGVQMLKEYRKKLRTPSENIFAYAKLAKDVKENYERRCFNSYADLCGIC